jgi:hypothetical protein
VTEVVLPIQDELAGVLGVRAADVIGVPLAIAFIIRTGEPGRFFVSGLSHDFATTAVESLGGHIIVGRDDGPSEGTLTIADAVWSQVDSGPAVGFGPVALAPTADPSACTNLRRLTVISGLSPKRSRLERAEQVRATFSLVADRLAGDLATAVDWSSLAHVEGTAQAWLAEGLRAAGATRDAAGSYLIELADELDDERIDQLGDGYERAAELWRHLAGGEWALGPELHELERTCAAWMGHAAGRPTRYAF